CSSDLNPVQVDYFSAPDPTGAIDPTVRPPTDCTSSGSNLTLYSAPVDSNGNNVLVNGNNSMCIPNAFNSSGVQLTAIAGSDGIPDGFVDPVRKYQAVAFEVTKSLSKGWLMRANYRRATLQGNYEGSFRNDNGQPDPNISSLLDFTQGDFKLLVKQFVPDSLHT